MEPRQLVESLFSQPQRCYGHCDQQATLRFLESGEPTVACYVCPGGYVSKVMVYGRIDATKKLGAFVATAMGGQPLKEEDIRRATRHSWDLAVPGFEMKVAYWTQNYRGSKSADPDRPGLFVCSRCGSAFVKPLTAQGMICSDCESDSAGSP